MASHPPIELRDPTVLVAPRFAAATTVRVDDETLRLDCHERGPELECAFEARYRATNSDAKHTVLAGFYATSAADVVVTVDGNEVSHEPTAAEAKALDDAVFGKPYRPGVAQDEALHDDDLAMNGPFVEGPRPATATRARWVFPLEAAAHGKHEIVVVGKVVVRRRVVLGGDGAEESPRHPLFAGIDADEYWDLDYFVSPVRTWDADPVVTIEVVHPPSITLEEDDAWGVDGPVSWTTTGTGFARRAVNAEAGLVPIGLKRLAPTRLNGGFVVGFGGATGDLKGARLRVAPELFFTRELLASVAWETDFRGYHLVTPLLALTSHASPFTPSIGVGLGAPVKVHPRARLGGRIVVDTLLHGFGVAASFDVFPAMNGEPEALGFTLLAQASF